MQVFEMNFMTIKCMHLGIDTMVKKKFSKILTDTRIAHGYKWIKVGFEISNSYR
jgi:hypothetical protein